MRYIVNADDLGRTETVNQAIFECFEKGVICNASVMVNMPFFDAATEYAREHGFIDKIGLHINLTSGFPLTDGIRRLRSLTFGDGRFNSSVFKKTRIKFLLTPRERRAVAEEVRAQLDRYLSCGYTLPHADSHGHVHTFPSFNRVVLRVLKEYGFESVRISRNIGSGTDRPVKRAVKMLLNRPYRRFAACTEYFGSIADAFSFSEGREHDTVEIMLHPNYLDGVFDIGEPVSIDSLSSFTSGKTVDYAKYIEEKMKNE